MAFEDPSGQQQGPPLPDQGNPLGSAGSAPQNPQAPMPAGPNPAQPNPAQAAQAADIGHHYGIGKMVRSLFGSERSYKVNPETGQTEATDSPMTGGQIFRNMVAGVLLGGAAGRNEKSFMKGAVAGGAAVEQNAEQQDKQKREQAGKDFQQGIEARRESREETMQKAQIALINAQTLRENQLLQREDIDWHDRKAKEGEAVISSMEKVPGVVRAYDNVPESKYNDLLKSNPDAAHLLWRPTGVTVVKHPDGTYGFEETYSAIKAPQDLTITVPDEERKQWIKDGMEKWRGTLPENMKVSYNEYLALHQQALTLRNDKDALDKKDIERRKGEAEIKELGARTKLADAEASRARSEAAKAAKEDKEPELIARAWETLSRDPSKKNSQDVPGAGGDFNKLSISDQILLRKDMEPRAKTMTTRLDYLLQNGQGSTDEAKQIMQNLRMLNDMSVFAGKPKATPEGAKGESVPVKVGNRVGTIPKDQLDEFLRNNPDAKAGKNVDREDILYPGIYAARSGRVVRFDVIGPPALDDLRENEQLLTDGRGNYIIRGENFKQDNWKSLGTGKVPEPVQPAPM